MVLNLQGHRKDRVEHSTGSVQLHQEEKPHEPNVERWNTGQIHRRQSGNRKVINGVQSALPSVWKKAESVNQKGIEVLRVHSPMQRWFRCAALNLGERTLEQLNRGKDLKSK